MAHRGPMPRKSRAGVVRTRYDVELDRHVQDSAALYQQRDREIEEEREAAKRQRFDNLQTIKGLSKEEFREMRRHISYQLPRTSPSNLFYRREQEIIMRELYTPLKKPVAPQHVIDIGHLQHEYFRDALWVCEQLGLVPLMKIKQDYNIRLVQQFYATLVFGDKDEVDIEWMTGDVRCKSNFIAFGALLGYVYKGEEEESGRRMHIEGREYSKNKLAPMYGTSRFTPGKASGLRQLYNILLRLYRECIAPSAGNLDDLRGGLVNLMYYSHQVYLSKGTGKQMRKLDVMDYIKKEMFLCMIDRKVPMYAPYVMRLIIAADTGSPLVSTQLVVHKSVKPQRKAITFEDESAPYPDERVDEEDIPFAPSGPRSKSTSTAFEGSSREFVENKVKKASFLERTLMCMCIDIRKSQYDQYVEQRRARQQQQQILSSVSLLLPEDQRPRQPSPPSQPSRGTLSYTAWNEGSSVNWKDYEEVTSSTSRAAGKQPMDPSEDEAAEASNSDSEYLDEHGTWDSDA